MDQSSGKKSVTGWIADLKAGDPEAVQRLWERYSEKLVRLANEKLGGHPRRVVGGSDVAQSVFASLCLGAERGQFPELTNRNDLWALLLALTRYKAADEIKKETRKKRGGGKLRGESAFGQVDRDGRPGGIGAVMDDQPTPQSLAAAHDSLQRLLQRVDQEDPSGTLRRIILWKIDGCTETELARKLDCAVRTVERKLVRIRSICIHELFEESWKSGEHPKIEQALALLAGKTVHEELFRKLLTVELHYRRQAGEEPQATPYKERFPDLAEIVDSIF